MILSTYVRRRCQPSINNKQSWVEVQDRNPISFPQGCKVNLSWGPWHLVVLPVCLEHCKLGLLWGRQGQWRWNHLHWWASVGNMAQCWQHWEHDTQHAQSPGPLWPPHWNRWHSMSGTSRWIRFWLMVVSPNSVVLADMMLSHPIVSCNKWDVNWCDVITSHCKPQQVTCQLIMYVRLSPASLPAGECSARTHTHTHTHTHTEP